MASQGGPGGQWFWPRRSGLAAQKDFGHSVQTIIDKNSPRPAFAAGSRSPDKPHHMHWPPANWPPPSRRRQRSTRTAWVSAARRPDPPVVVIQGNRTAFHIRRKKDTACEPGRVLPSWESSNEGDDGDKIGRELTPKTKLGLDGTLMRSLRVWMLRSR